jgi:hypothetical protein
VTDVQRFRDAVAALGDALDAAEGESRAATLDLATLLQQSLSRLEAAASAPPAIARPPDRRPGPTEAEDARLREEAADEEADVLQFVAQVGELERAADQHSDAVRDSLAAAVGRVEALRATLSVRREALRGELDALELGVRDQVRCFLDACAARAGELDARVARLAGPPTAKEQEADPPSNTPDLEPLRDVLRNLQGFAAEEGAALTRAIEELVATMQDVARTEDSFTRMLRTA